MPLGGCRDERQPGGGTGQLAWSRPFRPVSWTRGARLPDRHPAMCQFLVSNILIRGKEHLGATYLFVCLFSKLQIASVPAARRNKIR